MNEKWAQVGAPPASPFLKSALGRANRPLLARAGARRPVKIERHLACRDRPGKIWRARLTWAPRAAPAGVGVPAASAWAPSSSSKLESEFAEASDRSATRPTGDKHESARAPMIDEEISAGSASLFHFLLAGALVPERNTGQKAPSQGSCNKTSRLGSPALLHAGLDTSIKGLHNVVCWFCGKALLRFA